MTDKKISELASNGALAGNAGNAANGNSYITWVATGTRYGAIV